jgi:hypothetical protein
MKNLKLIIVLFLFTQVNFAQERKVYGIVKDSLGTLPGANVQIEGTNRGTTTDFDGKYSIKVNSNEFLIFSFIGKKNHRIIADKNEINIQLNDDGVKLIETFGPAYYPKIKRIDATQITKKDIENADNPKYNFKKNAKNNIFLIFVSDLTSYDFNKEDIKFQQKFNIKYSLTGNYKIDYLTKSNRLTFKHLKKKNKKTWQTEIRKDAIGLIIE